MVIEFEQDIKFSTKMCSFGMQALNGLSSLSTKPCGRVARKLTVTVVDAWEKLARTLNSCSWRHLSAWRSSTLNYLSTHKSYGASSILLYLPWTEGRFGGSSGIPSTKMDASCSKKGQVCWKLNVCQKLNCTRLSGCLVLGTSRVFLILQL